MSQENRQGWLQRSGQGSTFVHKFFIIPLYQGGRHCAKLWEHSPELALPSRSLSPFNGLPSMSNTFSVINLIFHHFLSCQLQSNSSGPSSFCLRCLLCPGLPLLPSHACKASLAFMAQLKYQFLPEISNTLGLKKSMLLHPSIHHIHWFFFFLTGSRPVLGTADAAVGKTQSYFWQHQNVTAKFNKKSIIEIRGNIAINHFFNQALAVCSMPY